MTALVDTGVFFAFYSLRDKHHMDSLGLIAHMVGGKWGKPFIHNHILDETLSITKYRLGPNVARAFLETFVGSGIIDILYTDRETEEAALKMFRENLERKELSYTDAVTIAVMKNNGIHHLLSFDLSSFRELVKNIIGPDYWNTVSEEEKKRILKSVEKYTGRKYLKQ